MKAAILQLTNLDHRLSWKCYNPDGSCLMTFRTQGDGSWLLSVNDRDTTMLLNANATKGRLLEWSEKCGTVLPFACFCAKCSPPELRAFHNQVGNVSHGLWPECVGPEQQRMAADLATFLRGAS